MEGFLAWITRPRNAGTVSLLLFFFSFLAVVIYVYTGKARRRRLESYKWIPLEDEDEPRSSGRRDGVGEDERDAR